MSRFDATRSKDFSNSKFKCDSMFSTLVSKSASYSDNIRSMWFESTDLRISSNDLHVLLSDIQDGSMEQSPVVESNVACNSIDSSATHDPFSRI